MTIEALMAALAASGTGPERLNQARKIVVSLNALEGFAIDTPIRVVEVMRAVGAWHEATCVKAEKIIKGDAAKHAKAAKETKQPVPSL